MKKIVFILAFFPMFVFGQVAKYGETKEKGFYEFYIAKDGINYKIGDKLKLGIPQGGNKTFTYIQYGNDLGGYYPLAADRSGIDLVIDRFYLSDKHFGFKMSFWMRVEGIKVVKYIVLFEDAIESGEIIGYGMTSDQAIQELKKWKDKLDLELITKDEYDEKKKELSKYIK